MCAALAHEIEGTGPRLALVHGFTQTARCWGRFSSGLAKAHEVMRLDAPGHGGSPEATHPFAAAGLIVETAGEATYVGYSMGGRLCLHAAIAAPRVVRGLVLISATPGIVDEGERAARVETDRQLADTIEAVGVDAFVEEWTSRPMFTSVPSQARFLEERRKNTVAGLAASLRLAGTGVQASLWDRLPELEIPVLLITGARDSKYSTIAQGAKERIGVDASFVMIGGCGHAPHLEKPDQCASVVADWLDRHHL